MSSGFNWSHAVFATLLVFGHTVQTLKAFEEVTETRYEITDDELALWFGRKRLRIPLDRIVRVDPALQAGCDMTWSRDSLGIAYRCRRTITDHVRISPSNPAVFLQALHGLCPHLEQRGKALVRRDTILPPTIPPNGRAEPADGVPIREPQDVRVFPADRDFSFCARHVYWPAVLWALTLLLFDVGPGTATGGSPTGKALVAVVAIAIVGWVARLAYRLLNTSYRLGDGTLGVRCGRLDVTIPLAAIQEIYPFPEFKPEEHKDEQRCWVWNPLRIDFRNKDGSIEWLLIGPRFREQFLDALRSRDPALIRCGEVLFRVESV